MSDQTLDPMRDDRLDRELRRFLELDEIEGAPSLDEMINRVAPAATGSARGGPWSSPATPAFRLVLVAGLLAALVVGAWAAGAWWNRNAPVVVAPAPTPAPTARPLLGSILGAGTWYVDIGTVRVTLDPPDDWAHGSSGDLHWFQPSPERPALLLVTDVANVLEAPCGSPRSPPVGPTVDDLVAALTELGLGASAPVETTVDGLPGKRLTLTAPASLEGCSGVISVWLNARSATSSYLDFGEETEISVVDVAGTRLVVRTIAFPGTTAEQRALTQATLDSIQLDPLPASPGPSQASLP